MLTTRRQTLKASFAVFTAAAAGACSPLGAIDAFLPGDGGTRVAASDLSYADGERRRLDIYVPDQEAAGPLPVLFFTHGGSWASGDKDEYDFLGRAFASAGFVTVIYNYRLVPEVAFPGFVEDGAAALARVREIAPDHGGDPDRIVLAGHSAGAYNTAMLALDRRFLSERAVPRQAIRGVVGLAGPYDFLPFDVEATKRAFGGYDDPEATQPVAFVDRDAPPFFLATGDADDTVKPRNTQALAERLREAGAPVEVAVYPDVGHAGILLAIAGPLRSRAPVYEDVVAFARKVTA